MLEHDKQKHSNNSELNWTALCDQLQTAAAHLGIKLSKYCRLWFKKCYQWQDHTFKISMGSVQK